MPTDVVGASIVNTLDGSTAVTTMAAADAQVVYAALKAREPHPIRYEGPDGEPAEGIIAWAAAHIITFETRDGGTIKAYLDHSLTLWGPVTEKHVSDWEVPEAARAVLLRYIQPVTD